MNTSSTAVAHYIVPRLSLVTDPRLNIVSALRLCRSVRMRPKVYGALEQD
jgi:hypothetical protein